MKSILSILAACLVIACCCSCSQSSPSTLVHGGYDEVAMEAAIDRARSEVDQFIAELSSPTGDSHAVKAPIEDGDETEHFWLTDVTYSDGQFKGLIGNDPGVVTNVTYGQSWEISKDEISDWLYMRDGKMYGNYTLRPLLVTMPEEEASALRAIFATP